MANGLRKMGLHIKLAWALNGVTYIAAVCMILFRCWPLHRQWQIYPDPGNNCYPGASKLNVSFITGINAATNLFLMAIHFPIIYQSHLTLKRKISLFVLYSGGYIVIIFGLLRCITLVSVSPTEPSMYGQWSVRESFLAVLINNALMVFPLLKRWFYAASGIMLFSHYNSSGAVSYTLGDIDTKQMGGSSKKSRSGRKGSVVHPLSIPNDTAWGSEETIVVDSKYAGR